MPRRRPLPRFFASTPETGKRLRYFAPGFYSGFSSTVALSNPYGRYAYPPAS